MSGECKKCGEHSLECSCKQKRPASITVKWISVKKTTPTPGERVLATDGDWVEIMWYKGRIDGEKKWGSLSLMRIDPTHWMALPPIPKDKA